MRKLAPVLALLASLPAFAQTGVVDRPFDPAKTVVLIVNDAVPESIDIGKHYCAMRHVPEENILHLNVTREEQTTWPDFREKILKPFTAFLEKFPEAIFVIPTYGVPVRIANEKSDKNPEAQPSGLGNSACLDAELALALQPDHEIEAWINNPLFKKERRITREDNWLMVSRLDGPTATIARELVDKAVYAETYGPKGKAWLDTRGLAEDGGSYGSTDCEMRLCLPTWDKFGIAHQDEDTQTLIDVSTCADAMFYWGWYAGTYNGTKPYKFNVGAVGAHLHSFSAGTLRSDKANWVGPLLAHGITCTLGTVYEPFTIGFPAMHTLYDRMLTGYTWGEAGAMAARINSWMCVYVGDPLYAPWSKGMKETQDRNFEIASKAYDRIAASIDANELDAAQKTLDELANLPVKFQGTRDMSFLQREMASRRLAPGTGPIKDLLAALLEGGSGADAKIKQAAIEKALAISPMNFEANIAFGKLLEEAGKHAPAIAALENARKVVPDAIEAAEPLGKALAATGKFKEAIPILKKAVENGAGADALEMLGDCCLKAGDPAQAVTYLSDAVKRNPNDRGAAMALAKACESARDNAGALKALQGAVLVTPESAEDVAPWKLAWKSLSTAAARAKDKPEADRSALALADLGNPLFEIPSKGAAAKIVKLIEDLSTQGKPVALKAPPSDALTGGLLPRLVAGNAGPDPVVIHIGGLAPREFQLPAAPGGQGKISTKEIGLFPGDVDIAIEAPKGKEKRLGTLHFRADLGKRYGFVLDGDLNPALPKKEK
ncbi:MAG: TIGR03790 family protein [Planctomycetes bacterium]|nr:TIGR03790 family protein [Planctomycetota bacterium]